MSTDRLLRIGLDPRWLVAALSALVVFQFAMDAGGSETAIWIAGFFLALQMTHGDCGTDGLPERLLAVTGLVALILAMSWVFSYGLTDTHRSLRLIKFLILIFAVRCLGRLAPEEGLARAAALVIAVVILWQSAARHLDANLYGVFEGPHYLAYFALLLVPPLILLSSWLQPPFRYALLLLLLPAADLILNDLTKPLIPMLSLTAATAAVLFFTSLTWRSWTLYLWFGLVCLAMLYLAPQAAAFFVRDERSTIWTDTLRMIGQGDWGSWIAGEGLGSFPQHFPDYSVPQFAGYSLPHNHFLELFYESGFLVVLIVIAGLIYLSYRSGRLVWDFSGRWPRRLALCNLALLAIWFVFSFFAFSVYSAYSLYPLAFIIGIHFALEDRLEAPSAGQISVAADHR